MIQPSHDKNPLWWLAALAVAVALLSLGAYLDNEEPELVVRIDDDITVSQAELDAALEVRHEVARVARDAHQQGMREAIDAIKGTPDGEAFERSCAALWRSHQDR